MKHVCFLFALVSCISFCSAQTAKELYEAQQKTQTEIETKQNNYSIQRGSKFIAGSCSFSAGYSNNYYYYQTISETVTKPTPLTISISGEFGGFITDKWTLSAGLTYGFSSTPTSQSGNAWLKQRMNLFAFGINIAEYGKITDKFYYVPQISLSYLLGNTKEDIDFTNQYVLKTSGCSIGGHLISFEFRPTDNFAIQLSVAYYYFTYMKMKNADMRAESLVTNYEIGNASVGFYYYF